MDSDSNLNEFKALFASSFSRNPLVTESILDPSAALPTEKLKSDVAALAKWLHAVARNSATSASNTVAKNKAVGVEDRMLRQLPSSLSSNRCENLRKLMVEAGGNVLITHDTGSIRSVEAFLTAQTKRQIAVPAPQQMSKAC